MDQEFVRVGYYVNNEYEDPILKETPPEEIMFDKIVRNVLSEKPRVTRIPIKWDSTDELGEPPKEEIIEEFSFPSATESNFSHAGFGRMEVEVGKEEI